MSKDEPTQSNTVKLAATKALLNSLEFTKANFEKEVRTCVVMTTRCTVYIVMVLNNFHLNSNFFYCVPLVQTERHIIMQVVCEATQVPHVPVQVAALQNLVRIMGLYYPLMEAYMGPALFAVRYLMLYLCEILNIQHLDISPTL